MADKKIEEATLAESITGTDVVPAAVGENPAPRKVTMEQIKNFTIAAIKDIAGLGEGETISADTDFVLTKRAVTDGFEEKHVGFDDIAKIVNDKLFFSSTFVSLEEDDLLAVYDSESGDTFAATLDDIVDFVRDNIGDVPMDINGLTAATDIADADALPAYQTREGADPGNKKVTVAQLSSKAFGDIHSKAVDITTETPPATFDATDCILIDKGGVVKKVQLQNSGLTKGGAKAPVSAETGSISTVTGNIPQWADNTTGTLTNGLDVVSSIGPASGTGAASDSNVPTEKAVRTAINAIDVSGKVNKPSSNSADYIPQWNGNDSGTLKNGKQVATSISAYATASDDKIPTEKAVRYSLDAKVSKPNSNHDGYIPQWYGSNSGELSDGKCVTESLASQESASNDNIPTEKAVRDAITSALTSVSKVSTYDTVVEQLSDLPATGYVYGALIIFQFRISGVINYGLAMNVNSAGSVSWRFISKLSDTLPTT